MVLLLRRGGVQRMYQHQQEAAAAPSSVAVAYLTRLLRHDEKDWTYFASLHEAFTGDGRI
jgi:hypothetical protein